MSLLRPIIRATAVAAIRDNTWAGSRCYDTDMTPLAEAVYGHEASPYVVVFTDADDFAPVRGVAEIYDGDSRRLQLVLELGVASSIKTGAGEYEIKFSHTDQGMEWAVDILQSQVLGALIGNTQSEWGQLFKRLVYKLTRMPSRRGGQTGGVRFAARRITMEWTTNMDVAPGVPVPAGHPIRLFIDMARAAPALGFAELATMIERLIQITAAPDWRQAQAILGITEGAARALHVDNTPLPWPNVEIPPLDWSDSEANPAPLERVTLVDIPAEGEA